MKHLWVQHFPLLRLLPFLLLSAAGWRYPSALAIAAVLSFLWWKKPHMGLLYLALSGLLLWRTHLTQPPPPIPDNLPQRLCGEVCSIPVATRSGYRLDLQITSPAPLRLRIYLKTTPTERPPKPGDQLAVIGSSSQPRPALNPGGFDALAYFQSQHLQGSVFATHWKAFPAHQPSAPSQLRLLQAALVNRLCRHLNDSLSREILPALALGDRSAMERETKQAFSRAGAIHVLAVSGMHLGLVYAMLTWLLARFIPGKPTYLRAVIELSGVWAFALLTGAAPSACRAALLISGLIVGRTTGRAGETLNILAGTAALQLFLDPHLLFNLGFQLSYAAVAGIVLFDPILRTPKWQTGTYLGWLCTSIRISTAAQIGTLPLVLYHFEQFPCYSWISSLLVIPAAGALLALSFACIATSTLPIGPAMAGLLESLCTLTWKTIASISEWPGALWKCPDFSVFSAVGITLVLILWRARRVVSQGARLVLASSCLLALFGGYVLKCTQNAKHSRMAILHSFSGLEAVVSGKRVEVYSLGGASADGLRFVQHGAPESKMWGEGTPYVFLGDKLVVNVQDESSMALSKWADVVVVTAEFEAKKKPSGGGIWVIPTHLKAWERGRWVDRLEQWNLPYWDVHTQGAWISSPTAAAE